MISAEDLFSRSRPINIGAAGRMLWVMGLTVVASVAWANWAVLDEQVRASGEVIVSSRSQIVQVVDGGVLQSLNVKEGELVNAGDVLAELDRTRFAANAAETRSKVLDLTANVERLRAELNGTPLKFSDAVARESDLADRQKNLHTRRLRQQREERNSVKKSLRLAQEELSALQQLARTGDASQSEVLSARRQVVELTAELTNRQNEYRRDAQKELASTQAELEQTLQIYKQRQEALAATIIRAPMSGSIKNIRITTLGAVLKAGDELLQIVPSDEPLLVEVRIYSKDVAFVRPGLRANVKLDAYDSSIYGSLEGEVVYVSPDTIDEDLRQNEDPYYRAQVKITQLPERKGIEPIEVIPGMTATAEIITGHRTVAQYILKPLRRGSAEALTER
ncbi:MAG: secretion protein [Spongiibacter sp.]|uniref:HlyD family efflux transporter periplasmic adaptor subunit n=1 Tax=Spongiibacter sp. TaxID=2024860 RepID=UPI000C0A34FA|nr:HlyD family efflux transporter periplasmic adaptor subunit [Spongiibacter sp.]MAK45264.1 secretion protein [Spongiibacter sp.]|tara:strand:+ start:26 stop:1204 length:1179 start_codon:yes stop_codon:yes gene_type:complete